MGSPWLLREIVCRDNHDVVGYINFHGEPDSSGRAELGYTVFEGHRRNGYATEAILAMIEWAKREQTVSGFLLAISPDNQPSLALAAKLGFQQIGTQIDEIDGKEYVFELTEAL